MNTQPKMFLKPGFPVTALSFSSQTNAIRLPAHKNAPVQFSGVTSDLAGKHWLNSAQFNQYMGVCNSGNIGYVPEVLSKLADQSHSDVFQAINELSGILNEIPLFEGLKMQFTIGERKEPVEVEYVGKGAYGVVYRLKVGTDEVALKLYKRSSTQYSHGTYGEMGTGLYFNPQTFENIVRFEFGNTKNHWGVYEFADSTVDKSKRPDGKFEEQNVVVGDDHGGNSISGFRVDYGGINQSSKLEDLRQALADENYEHPVIKSFHLMRFKEEDRQDAALLAAKSGIESLVKMAVINLEEVKDEQARMEIVHEALKFNTEEINNTLTKSFSPIPKKERFKVFKQFIQQSFSDDFLELSYRLYLLEMPAQIEAFKILMKSGDLKTQIELLGLISRVPERFRSTIVKTVFKKDNPELLKHLPKYLNSFSGQEQLALYNKLWRYDSPEIKLELLRAIRFLDESRKMEKFEMALNDSSPEVRQAAVASIGNIGESMQGNAIDLVLALEDEALDAHLITVLSELPEEHRSRVFDLALSSGDTALERRAIWRMNLLPSAKEVKIYDDIMDTGNKGLIKLLMKNISKVDENDRLTLFKMYVELDDSDYQDTIKYIFSDLPDCDKLEGLDLFLKSLGDEKDSTLWQLMFSIPNELTVDAFKLMLENQVPMVVPDMHSRLGKPDKKQLEKLLEVIIDHFVDSQSLSGLKQIQNLDFKVA